MYPLRAAQAAEGRGMEKIGETCEDLFLRAASAAEGGGFKGDLTHGPAEEKIRLQARRESLKGQKVAAWGLTPVMERKST